MRRLAPLALVAALGLAPNAHAQQTPPAATPPPPSSPPEAAPVDTSITPGQVHLESDVTPPPTSILPEAPPEAPPPLPRHKGFVVEGSLGGMTYFGQFKHVAPTAPWLQVLVGYEFLKWLMLYGEGELAFTDTSIAEDASHSFAFPIFGFGLGLRVTVHATDRLAFYAQGSLGGMKADVPHGALQILGYKNAESVGLSFGGRLGVEWYQIDRHMALGLGVGLRDATGFARVNKNDLALMADASASIRYTF